MARLAVVALCGLLVSGGTGTAGSIRTVVIDIEHSRFVPNSIVIEKGEEVRFVIRNHDPTGDTLYGIDIAIDPKHRGVHLTRRIYEARVSPDVQARMEYFDQELVRTLADGDRTLLGSAP